ncbi:hypothetical protein AYO47_09915, partial [Planctomyces sp. SCGC AG-212-M04]
MSSNLPGTRPIAQAACVLVVLAVLLVSALWKGQQPLAAPAVERPGSSVAVRDRCVACHSEIVGTYQNAPHANTLHRATDASILSKFSGRSFTRSSTGVEYRYTQKAGELWLSTPAYGREVPIKWILGSGTHAQTPLITLPDADGRTGAIEHIVSWYPSGRLETTFGADKSEETLGLGAIGRHWGPAETAGCFGCHSAEVPLHDGRLDEAHITPNLDCARCHVNTGGHVRQMEPGGETTIERLASLPPLEAVERCGECHRRAEDFDNAIFHDNTSIIRFAPVGLTQSPCFLKQSEVKFPDGKTGRMDCATCHDPHVGSVRPDMISISCGKCHQGTPQTASHCTSPMTA